MFTSKMLKNLERKFKKLRKDFPILNNKTTGKYLVYFDNAATTQKPRAVIEKISRYYSTYNSNIHRGIYKIAEKATLDYEKTREKIAGFIGAQSGQEIIFTRNATESINLAAKTWGEENIKKGDGILTIISEHHSNFVPWQILAKAKRADFSVVPVNEQGEIDSRKLLAKETKKTKIICLAYVSNVLGIINPIEKIIKLIKKKNPKTRVLIDGAQAVGHLKVDVKKMDCDFFAFSSHKMFGPDGVGVLYAKKEILEKMEPFLTGGDTIKEVGLKETLFNAPPWKFEAGTPNISGVIGLGETINYLGKISLRDIKKYEEFLAFYLLKSLKEINGIEIYGSQDLKKKIPLFSFNIKGIHPHDIAQFLDRENIAVRAGHHCAMPLHYFLGVSSSLRVSLAFYNTKEEIDKFKENLILTIKFFKRNI